MKAARILIVDDNLLNLKLAASVLECAGHEILTAEDATAALTVLGRRMVDLILMDIALPGMDGLTLTRQIKANPATAGVPVVALTAFAMKGDDEKAKEAGCDGYITKPIDTRKFADQIGEILERTGTRKERQA